MNRKFLGNVVMSLVAVFLLSFTVVAMAQDPAPPTEQPKMGDHMDGKMGEHMGGKMHNKRFKACVASGKTNEECMAMMKKAHEAKKGGGDKPAAAPGASQD